MNVKQLYRSVTANNESHSNDYHLMMTPDVVGTSASTMSCPAAVLILKRQLGRWLLSISLKIQLPSLLDSKRILRTKFSIDSVVHHDGDNELFEVVFIPLHVINDTTLSVSKHHCR